MWTFLIDPDTGVKTETGNLLTIHTPEENEAAAEHLMNINRDPVSNIVAYPYAYIGILIQNSSY